MFHEDWYPEPQLISLSEKARLVSSLEGKIIEIGCWEGKSTAALANAVYPQVIDAVDTWQGNYDESCCHVTITLAKERDIFAEFQKNISELTKGNLIIYKRDCFVYLATLQGKVKFCHIDACHDYASVKQTIRMLLPKLASGGILCGDDYVTANAQREDLQGGVQKAVLEMCPGHLVEGNFWWWVK
jgi:hypothetical protein